MAAPAIKTRDWTRRQREVFGLLTDGYSNREIADRLGISLDGAKWHVSEILGELGVSSREEAAEYWRSNRGRSAQWRRPFAIAVGLAGGVAAAGVVAAVLLSVFSVGEDDAPLPGATASPVPPGTPAPRGVFAPVGDMAVPRSLHASVALDDGSIVILGGNAQGSLPDPVSNSVERFDPGRLVFGHAGELAVARQTFTATLLDDGTVLVAGGVTRDGLTASTEIYDPNTRTSVKVGELTAARAGHVAAKLPDGRVLLIGGLTNEGLAASTEYFDPKSGTFALGPALHFARAAVRTATLPDGSILVVGDGSAERLDPRTGTFALVAGPEANLPEVPTALLNGQVLITGGYDVAEERATPDTSGMHGDIRPATTRAVLLDPATGEVTTTGSMHSARLLHEAVRLDDGRVLVVGGAQTTHFDGDHVAAAEIYDPATGNFQPTGAASAGRVWFTLNLLPAACASPAPCVFRQDVLLVGDNGGAPYAAEVYRP